MELEEIKLATKKYCFYKLATSGKIYDINVKELDQVFCVGYHALSFERDYLKFIKWMKEENYFASFRVSTPVKGVTAVAYALPLSHKIKYLSAEMKAVIAYIQNQDDNNFVICTDEIINAEYEGFWFDLWMKFREATGFYSQFIHNLFRIKALDVACEIINLRK